MNVASAPVASARSPWANPWKKAKKVASAMMPPTRPRDGDFGNANASTPQTPTDTTSKGCTAGSSTPTVAAIIPPTNRLIQAPSSVAIARTSSRPASMPTAASASR